MKKLFLFFCCILYSQLHSQKIYSFNVELNDKKNAPTFTIIDNEFKYNGKNQVEKSFFENYLITNFYATYPNYSGYLQNVFTFITTSSKLMDDLKKQFPTVYLKTEDLTGMNLQLVSYPNDYGTTSPVTNLGSSMSLKSFDYVNAPKAWDFFPNNTPKGNVIIGISDGMVNSTDLDFSSKVSYLQQNLFNPTYVCEVTPTNDPGFQARHGTAVAAIAAAQGNNGNGITGVCYDCDILNIPYTVDGNNPNFSGLMQLAQQGARVINMSWIQGFNYNDPTYTLGYHQTQQDAINQLHNMGVVLVAAAGNQSSWDTFTAPNHVVYSYPASYEHVISVTVVHAKNSNILDEVTGPIPTWGYVSNYNEDVLCVNGGLGFDLANPVFAPFYNQSTTTNSRVDICAPAYAPLYPNYILGCPGLYGDTTSIATPFVTGTVALMQSLNSCILPDEVEDVLQLTSKNLEIKPENINFIGRSGSGKLETGDAVEFTHHMMSPTGNVLIDGQNFWRFNFDLQHINNRLTISNQIFRDSNTSNFIAKNVIEVLNNSDFRPNANGFVDLKIDGALTVCPLPSSRNQSSGIQENHTNKINKAKLYPNPNSGTFSILLSQIGVKNLEVTIFDIIGKSVYNTKVDQNEFELNVSHLPSGMYLVKLSSNSINETLKFVKK